MALSESQVYQLTDIRLRGKAWAAFAEAARRGYLVAPPGLSYGAELNLLNAWLRWHRRKGLPREGLPRVEVRRTAKRAYVTLAMPDGQSLSAPGIAAVLSLAKSAAVKHKRFVHVCGRECSVWVKAEDAEPLAAALLDLALEHTL
jgi:hypothetical protein